MNSLVMQKKSFYFPNTDLPVVISGERLAYMEPQEKVWPEKSGRSYSIRNIYTQNKLDSLAPFEGVAGFSSRDRIYPGTLFRFPLRDAPSELSEKLYTVHKLRKLLSSLKEEAKFLLLFLHSVQKIEVYEISTDRQETLSFQVVICEKDDICHKRERFMNELRTASARAGSLQYHITRSIDLVTDFHVQVTDFPKNTTRVSHWLVANQVGSQTRTVLDTAAKQHAFPWVGVALELRDDSRSPISPGGRIFCFLPTPTEASSPFPVHVNGTFGLNDDRRTLKWPTVERQNDTAADWNKLLVSELLPSCYAKLLMEAKKHLSPQQFYKAWPKVGMVDPTPWEGLLIPLFQLLFNEAVFWTRREGAFGGQWIVQTQGTFIERGSALSSVVHKVLSNCGIKLVEVPGMIWEALTYTEVTVHMLSPSTARKALRSHRSTYQDCNPGSKLELLTYCLSDKRYSALNELALLPLADGSFVDFEPNWSSRRVKARYVCSDKCPRDLLPNIDKLLVDLPDNPELQASLQEVACSQQTQLQNLSVQLVAQLLPQCFPSEWQTLNCVSLTSSSPHAKWLERFWRWVQPYSLSYFTGLLVLPLTSEGKQGFQVTRLTQHSTVVYISEYCPSQLLRALTKLQVHYTQSDEFSYLHHWDLFSYLNRYNSGGVFTAIMNAWCDVSQLQIIKFAPNEAQSLQLFLSTGSAIITTSHRSVLQNLPLFSVLNQSKLYSIEKAQQKSWEGKAVLEPDNFDISEKHLPQNLVIFSRSQNQRSLLSDIGAPNRTGFFLNVLFPMISSGAYPDTMLDSLMEEVLQLSPMLISQFPFYKNELTYQISNLAFLCVNPSSSVRKPPNQLFDPSKEDLKELFKGEEKFPIDPFNQHLQILCKYGLRQTVTGKEIVAIINSISTKPSTSPQKVSSEHVSRAKAVLKYLSARPSLLTEKVSLSSIHFSSLLQALQTLAKQRSWLPVYSASPQSYSKCLVWKGRACTSHLASLGAPVLLCNSDDIKTISLVVGSQMFLVQCSSSEICSLLNTTATVPSHAVAHLQQVIKHSPEIEDETIGEMVHYIYRYLKRHLSELNDDLSSLNWIWIESQHTFVSSDVVAIERNSSFHENPEPYLYILPNEFRKFSKLFLHFGVEEYFTPSQILSVLKRIKDKKATDRHAWSIVMSILNWLTDHGQKPADVSPEDLYVPVESRSGKLKLMKASDVIYTDIDFLQNYLTSDSESDSEDSYTFVHHRIHSGMARNLGVTPLSEYLDISEDAFEDAGQHEPLAMRIKNILKDYKDGLTIVKELLQNADDAEATEVNICYDARTHKINPKSLFYAGMAECHGPALIVHNDAVFTEDDFKNITKLAGATKMDQPLKIGKFGVGFCSVYHITDVPSFVSCDFLYIFDPTLKHLRKVVKDSTRPGKRLRFTEKIVASSKQLAPYTGLYDFDSKSYYNGTIFRFPFRSSPSEISHITYSEAHIKQLITDIQNAGSKLLLFLRNVQRITFSRIDEKDQKPRLVMEVRRKNLPQSSERLLPIFKVESTSLPEEYWLLASHSDAIDSDNDKKYATASVACLLEKKSTRDCPNQRFSCYLPKPIKGEVFCFLPLTLKTGLPVHVSSNFAVNTDRRGIRSSDDESRVTDEVQWNIDLMQYIIPKAYQSLLKVLHCMCENENIQEEDYKFYSLWPLKDSLKTHNPWDSFVQPLYTEISSSELFFSESTAQWLMLSDSKFLGPHILCHPTPQCVIEVMEKLHQPIVHLPAPYQHHLSPDIESYTIDEEDFLEIFFDNIDSLKKICNKVLHCLLHAFAVDSTSRKENLQEYLENKKCIPCTPRGKELKKCSELIDPSVYFAKLYDPEDGVFPIKEFHSNKLINTALIQLKMISSFLPWNMLTERVKTIHKLYTKDRHKALERVRLLIKCIKNNISNDSEIDNSLVEVDAQELATINFLPVMQKPSVYPLTWYGDSYDLLSPCELLHGEHNVLLAGSEAPIICESKPKEGGCGPIPPSVISFLGIQTCATTDIVIKQMHQLIDAISSQQPQVTTGWTERTSSRIYTFLETILSKSQEEDLSELKETNSVWTGEEFVSPKAVATTWDHNGPYLFRLPDILKYKTNLVATLNIQECFLPSDFLGALHGMHTDFGSDPVDSKCQKLIPTLVNELTSTEDLPTDITCYLPDTSFAMCEASELAYNDAKWCEIDEEYTFVNDIIPRESAIKLGVKPVRSKLLEQYESSFQHFAGVEFGQRELLTQRIKNILREYPFDITVLKELLQNADDSKATKMYVVLDKRSHGEKKIPSSNWKDLQGPSLLVWNDSVFSESDLKGIQKLGLGSKRSDAETIGQYGIGFNVVYHLTDCPSFLTNGNTLCVLDPHCRYVPGASALTPGRRYDKLDEKFWLNWADLRSTYLREDIPGCPAEIKGGSLFRFPLRCTTELMKQSELVDHESSILQVPISFWKMEQNLKEWAPDMKDALIFLNHVTELKFFVITDSERKPKMHLTDHFKVQIDQAAIEHRTELHIKASAFTSGSEACVITYPIELIDIVAKETNKWLIQQGVGDIDSDESTWMFASRVKPKHGIAAPLTSSGPRTDSGSGFRGKLFCFLPLPLNSNLPVHVNGNFILDASRRDLWHPTIKDKPDDRTRWNQELMEAIASSYADFLVKCQSAYVLPSIYQSRSKMWDDIQHYYKVFPRWLGRGLMSPERELLQVAKMVYQKLYKQNAMILAIIKKLPAAATTASKSHLSSSKRKFQIEWHPLVNKEEPSKQAYFWHPSTQAEKALAPVLEIIGMYLTAAPMNLHHHFSDKEIELVVASRDSVYEYYTMFYHQVAPMGHFPCHISETVFQSVENFNMFTNYLLHTSKEQHPFKEFPESPLSLPLLLTADGQLCVFTESEKVINSHFSLLFPESADKFLHPEMLEMRYVPTYFQQCTSDNWNLVSSILSATLPNALLSQRVQNADKHVSFVSLLKPLWQCLTLDKIFANHLEPIVREWALLPSTNNKLFSFRSEDQLLPIVPVDFISTTPITIHEHAFQIIQQIGMPILDVSVVTADQCRPFCPCLSEPQRILTNLYYLHTNGEGNLSSLLTDRSVDTKICKLFEYLKQIHFANDESSLHKIKFLPLFKNIDGNFCTLLGDVYIWPGHICMAGSEIWLRQSHVVFLERAGVWNRLAAASVLGIIDVSTLEVYNKFVFPQFEYLDNDDRLKQLQYIRDELFSSAVSGSKMGEFDEQRALVASEFIAALKQLPCLLEDGILKPVCEFCDPNVSIFVAFQESFSFPPDELTDDKWLEFFRKIGLRTEVTHEEFLEFCYRVSNGYHENLKKASSVLLHYLFQFEEWCEDYEFLSQVSDIPFVCVENLPKLNWIRPIFPAENRIQQGTKTTDLARLCNAAVFEFRELVWTVKPVVKVPSIPWYYRDRKKAASFKTYLGINTPPTISEVVQNVYNISETRFSKFDLFDKYSEECKMKKTHTGEEETPLLLSVMVNNFEYLKNNHSGGDLRSSLGKLCDATCVPVCVEGKTSGIRQPVLVAPLQVIASDTEELKQFHPLLNPLPDDLYSVVPGVLSVVGVQMDIHLGHIRFALETASKFRQPLDQNTATTVRYLLRKLYHLLQIVGPTTKPSLSPLYLPSIENQLVDSTQLLYHDTWYFEKGQFDFSEVPYSLFSLLASRMEAQDTYGFTHRQFCQSLPPEVCPKALLECCRGELHESCIDSIESQLSEFAKRLQKSFVLPIFSKAACAILKSNSNEEELSYQFVYSLEMFLQNTQIFSVRNLQSNLLLKLVEPPKKIGTAKLDFLLQRNDESISLYIDAEAHALRLNLFELLTSAIVSCVAEIGGIDVKSLKQPDLAISYLLKAETAGDVSRLLEDLEVHFAFSDVELGDPFDPNLKPKLGSPIPESWHHRLQIDINNIFRPEEWVGYEVREDHIIFALVAHRIVPDEQSSELEEDKVLDQYLIYTCEGDEEGKSVSVIELYKILRAKISQSENEEAGTELVLFDPDSDTTQVWNALKGDEFKKIRKEICRELRRIWKLPEVLRRKAIKALYFKWHPDKNDHPLATKAFQFLQCQIARLHAGKPLQDPEDEDAEESADDETTYPDSSWRHWFHTWDDIARSHRRAREQERMYYRSRGGFSLGNFYTRPKPDQTTAVVWIRQAEADLKALQLLQDHTNHHPQVCAHVCFHAHEVAEKALKAGMYAVCGLHPESLQYHDLDGHAGALEQERPALTIGLRVYASSLRNHYLKSRFPNQYHPPTTPSDVYTQDQARDARQKAEMIFDMMTEVVQN